MCFHVRRLLLVFFYNFYRFSFIATYIHVIYLIGATAHATISFHFCCYRSLALPILISGLRPSKAFKCAAHVHICVVTSFRPMSKLSYTTLTNTHATTTTVIFLCNQIYCVGSVLWSFDSCSNNLFHLT